MHTLDPQKLSQKDLYKLLIGAIVPRPIALVSTVNSSGLVNLAPVSSFNLVSSNPMCMLFSMVAHPDGRRKDTLNNVLANKELVLNTVSKSFIEKVVHCGADFDPDQSELDASGLTSLPSEKIKPPRIAEAPVQFECRLHSFLEIGDGTAGSSTIVVAEAVCIHLADDIYKDGRILHDKLHAVGRLGGISYCTLGEIFDLKIPPPNIK